MCDYSLELYNKVDAKVGETYTLHRFPSGTQGFTKEGATNCAVCMKAGSALTLISAEGHEMTAVFDKLEAKAFTHRDGVFYVDGHSETLQTLKAGTKARMEYIAPEDADLSDKPLTVIGEIVGEDGRQPVEIALFG